MSGKLAGKKAVLVIPSDEGGKACRHAVGMFTLSFKYLEVDLVGKWSPKTPERAIINEMPKTLAATTKLGKSL